MFANIWPLLSSFCPSIRRGDFFLCTCFVYLPIFCSLAQFLFDLEHFLNLIPRQEQEQQNFFKNLKALLAVKKIQANPIFVWVFGRRKINSYLVISSSPKAIGKNVILSFSLAVIRTFLKKFHRWSHKVGGKFEHCRWNFQIQKNFPLTRFSTPWWQQTTDVAINKFRFDLPFLITFSWISWNWGSIPAERRAATDGLTEFSVGVRNVNKTDPVRARTDVLAWRVSADIYWELRRTAPQKMSPSEKFEVFKKNSCLNKCWNKVFFGLLT